MGVLSKLAGATRPEIPKKTARAVAAPASNPVAAPSNPVKRDARGRLLPGQANLNPGGRPKGREAEMREMLERAGGDAFLEGLIRGEVQLPSGELQEVRDLRLRLEAYRMAADRAHGKALERSASVNVDLAGGEAPVALDRLPEGVLRGLLGAAAEAMSHNAPQLPQGQVVDADFQLEDLPGTDAVSDQSSKG